MRDALNEFAYDAELAGLSYDLAPGTLGIHISVSGYNDKLHVLVRHILEKARNLEVEPDRLEVMKEQVFDSRHNDTFLAC